MITDVYVLKDVYKYEGEDIIGVFSELNNVFRYVEANYPTFKTVKNGENTYWVNPVDEYRIIVFDSYELDKGV